MLIFKVDLFSCESGKPCSREPCPGSRGRSRTRSSLLYHSFVQSKEYKRMIELQYLPKGQPPWNDRMTISYRGGLPPGWRLRRSIGFQSPLLSGGTPNEQPQSLLRRRLRLGAPEHPSVRNCGITQDTSDRSTTLVLMNEVLRWTVLYIPQVK